jgi:hypothetical protein
MDRESFSFFRSFFEQLVKIRNKDPNSATALLWAIVNYGMTKQEPNFSEDQFIADVAWVNLKIVLDNGWAKYENGTKPKQKKTKRKQTKSETEANEKQSQSESGENKNKKENKKEKKNENIKEREREKSSHTTSEDNIKTDFDDFNFSTGNNDYSTLTNAVWSEQVIMTLHMTPEQYKQKVEEFTAEQRIKGTHHIDDNDIRNHFYSWLKIQQNGNNNQPNKTESARERSIRENEEEIEREWARILNGQG